MTADVVDCMLHSQLATRIAVQSTFDLLLTLSCKVEASYPHTHVRGIFGHLLVPVMWRSFTVQLQRCIYYSPLLSPSSSSGSEYCTQTR
jgi:hypothetical protein